MHTHRRIVSPIVTKSALALGALFGLAFAPQPAFAGLAITTLASFNITNGSTPNGGVILDSSGNLYGTTAYGGANGDGAVYEIANGTTTISDLASFNSVNGSAPYGSVTLDSSGNLFGTTSGGGANNVGTVYEIANGSSAITTLASFNAATGDIPASGVTLDSSGNLYGTTQNDGDNGQGTVYEIANGSNTITPLASFNTTDGSTPYGGITLDSSGNLYGTTEYGGDANGDGLVYEIANGSNTITPLASFNSINGANPYSGVTLDSRGNLFGTATYGGDTNGDGTVYEIANGSSTITLLASFDTTQGANPYGGVILDSSGNLFGTTVGGGDNGQGTVYEIANGSSAITVLASFNSADGAFPFGGVTLDGSGDLFGTTAYGGDSGQGTVYEIANADLSPAPEPSQSATLGLVVTGLTALILRVRRRTGAASAQANAEH